MGLSFFFTCYYFLKVYELLVVLIIKYTAAGIRGKAKPKFMFHSQRKEQSCSVICEDRLCSASISKVHSLSETFDAITSRTDKYPTECLEDLVEEFDDQFDVGPALNCGNTESSISELLDGLKDKNSSLGGVTNGYICFFNFLMHPKIYL